MWCRFCPKRFWDGLFVTGLTSIIFYVNGLIQNNINVQCGYGSMPRFASLPINRFGLPVDVLHLTIEILIFMAIFKSNVWHPYKQIKRKQPMYWRYGMDKQDCVSEKWSSRTIGLIILPLAMALGFLGFLILPVVGLFFAIPLFILSFVFIMAPESKVCRLILRKES